MPVHELPCVSLPGTVPLKEALRDVACLKGDAVVDVSRLSADEAQAALSTLRKVDGVLTLKATGLPQALTISVEHAAGLVIEAKGAKRLSFPKLKSVGTVDIRGGGHLSFGELRRANAITAEVDRLGQLWLPQLTSVERGLVSNAHGTWLTRLERVGSLVVDGSQYVPVQTVFAPLLKSATRIRVGGLRRHKEEVGRPLFDALTAVADTLEVEVVGTNDVVHLPKLQKAKQLRFADPNGQGTLRVDLPQLRLAQTLWAKQGVRLLRAPQLTALDTLKTTSRAALTVELKALERLKTLHMQHTPDGTVVVMPKVGALDVATFLECDAKRIAIDANITEMGTLGVHRSRLEDFPFSKLRKLTTLNTKSIRLKVPAQLLP